MRLFAPIGALVLEFCEMQPKRIVHRVRSRGEPLRPRCRHMEMVFQTDTEFTRHTDHWLVAETHAFGKRGIVAADQIRPLMNIHADAVAGAVRQAGQLVIRAEAARLE